MEKIKLCKYCFKEHSLQYLDSINGTQHLIYRCTNRKKKTTVFLTYIPNLDIPHTLSKQQLKEKQLINQISLF